MSLTAEAAALTDDLTALRHAIHQEPEIGLDLPLTQRKVLDALDGLGLEITTGESLSSVTAVLRGGSGGSERAVLLRGDMDALPVTELTGLPYASRVDGAMHACGHDQHVTMLAGAARLLAEHRAELAGDVIFMFQPGEEGYDGASHMIREGLLRAAGVPVTGAYAIHVMSGMAPCGLFFGRGGTLHAGSDKLQVTVRGRGGHGSMPHLAADPVPVACEMVLALQNFITRNVPVFDPAVLTVGVLQAGTLQNIIPETAEFTATVRSFSEETRRILREGTPRVCEGIAAAHGLSVDAQYVDIYPPTVNDVAEAEFAAGTIRDSYGESRYLALPDPLPASEDFSRVLAEVSGAMVMLGACPPGTDPASAPMNHSPYARYDDSVLPDGAALLAELALKRLAR